MSDYVKITYRDIAKMLCKALPLEGEEYGNKVNEILEIVKDLPIEAKQALKAAYIFSRKAPREEREDLFQDLALAVWKAKTDSEKLAYTIARCDWLNWWKKYKLREHTDLDSIMDDTEGNGNTLSELLIGTVEFENRLNGDLDGERIWNLLPDNIKLLVDKRLIGKALTATERQQMSRFVRKQGASILLAAA